jgi:outer membrane receptor for ferrienterochelin and colicins
MNDETGHYFFKNLPIGEHTIVVSAIGYKTETRTVSLTAGQTLEIDIQIEEDFISLDGVVVSANRTETTRRLAPTLVNVMSGAAFEATTSTCVADGLNFQPGVRVENNCQNCGFQQIRINGLDGPYTQILIDSRPIFNALSGVYGIEQIPVNMVDRVEVMRGGGSALFGSSAIAGTVNIITKEPATNSASLSHSTTSIGGTSALDNITMLNASLVTDDHKMGIAVFGQNRQRDGYDANGDGYTELPTINSQNIGTRMFLKTGTYSRITGEYHHLQEYRRGGDSLSIPPHEANIAEEVTHSINTGSVKFDYFAPNEKHRLSIFGSIQHIDRESYYGAGQNPNAYGGTTDLTWVAGAQYNYKFDKCIFMQVNVLFL